MQKNVPGWQLVFSVFEGVFEKNERQSAVFCGQDAVKSVVSMDN